MEVQPVILKDLGKIEYKEAWEYQEHLLKMNLEQKALSRKNDVDIHESGTTHYLLFCEHPPVYTLGKSGDPKHVLMTDADRIKNGIEYFHTNRGGDITYHGPGQIVGYPILDLEKFYTDVKRYLQDLEEVIIRTISDYGLKGMRSPGETGVWLDPDIRGRERKIAAIGVRCSRWITMHGFALNVNTNLSYFDHIIPCGISNKQVTSIKRELGDSVDDEDVKQKLIRNFESVYGVECITSLVC